MGWGMVFAAMLNRVAWQDTEEVPKLGSSPAFEMYSKNISNVLNPYGKLSTNIAYPYGQLRPPTSR